MPRRALILITVLVLALHWWLLGGLPLGATDEGSAARLAFHTRMVTPPSEPEPAPAPQPQPQPQTRHQPKPTPKPRPKPQETQATAQAPTQEPAQETPEPASEEAGQAASGESSTERSETSQISEGGASELPGSIPSIPESAASAPTAIASAPTTTPAVTPSTPGTSGTPADELSAGVDIRPPGAAGAQPSTEPPPIKLPPSTTLAYAVHGEVKKMSYNVFGELAWKTDGASYEVRQEVSAFLLGSRSQNSTGAITPEGLAPKRFGDKGRREVAAHFDYAAKEIIFSANSQRVKISTGAQDRVSVLIQLAGMLAAAPERYPTGTQISFTTIGPRNADRWTFTVGETATLDLPAGPTPAIKLLKVPRHERDLTAELWLGTQKSYLPVRLKITQSNGDFAELSLK